MSETKTIKVSEKKLSKLIMLLRDGDSLEKEKAMQSLLDLPTKKVTEQVAQLLQGNETGVRMAAVEILKKIGSYNLEIITGLLDDENEDIRVYACEILGSIQDKNAIPYLIKKLSEENENVRNTACIALGEINDEQAVDALLGALKDDEWIKFSAIYGLGKIGSKRAIAPLIDVFENDEEEVSLVACEVLVDIGDGEILDQILVILKTWNEKKRGNYIKILLERENEDTFQILKEKMGEELFEHLLNVIKSEDKKSFHTMKLLANFKNIKACEVILGSFKNVDPTEEEYYEKLQLFTELREVWKDHVRSLMDKDDEYLLPLIKACGIAHVKIDEDVLLKKFISSSIDVKKEIAKNAPIINKGRGLSLVREAIKDSDGHIMGDAITFAGNMGMMELKDEIAEIVKKGFFDVRIKSLKALMKLDLNNAVELIEEFVNNGSAEDKKLYLSVATQLNSEKNFIFIEKLLRDPDENVKKATIGIIGHFLDDERYMDLFKALLIIENIPHEVLKIIKDKRLYAFQGRLVEIFLNEINGLWTRYYALLALGAFENGSLFEIFLKGLDDDNNLIKIGSLKALSDLNDKRALSYIRPFAQSQNEDIRSTAEYMIERLDAQ